MVTKVLAGCMATIKKLGADSAWSILSCMLQMSAQFYPWDFIERVCLFDLVSCSLDHGRNTRPASLESIDEVLLVNIGHGLLSCSLQRLDCAVSSLVPFSFTDAPHARMQRVKIW